MIRYKHAYDENHNLVNIECVDKETRHNHKFFCPMCGAEMTPRLGEIRQRHFKHTGETEHDSESYLHFIAKSLIKKRFEEDIPFKVSYGAKLECDQTSCNLRNTDCRKDITIIEDLKKKYDTATIEAPINGFVADVLLSNSKNSTIAPTLLEICVTHKCEDEKRNMGLPIIEIKIQRESDIMEILNSDTICEHKINKNKWIEFISFGRTKVETLKNNIHRFVYNPEETECGYISRITCDKREERLRSTSRYELNVVSKHGFRFDNELVKFHALRWLQKNKQIRLCTLCKFFYATQYERFPICRLSKKYGTPARPSPQYAISCRSFHAENDCFTIDTFRYEEVTSSYDSRAEFKVIIVTPYNFSNYKLLNEKCSYYLSNVLKKNKVIIITGNGTNRETCVTKFANENNIQMEPHPAKWDEGDFIEVLTNRNIEQLKVADAAIVFMDKRSKPLEMFIDSARKAGIRVAIVNIEIP